MASRHEKAEQLLTVEPADSPAAGESVACLSFTHEALFREEPLACDACDARLPTSSHAEEEENDDGYAIGGKGLLMWSRGQGENVRWEEPSLCPKCSAAIGISALIRWEIEEEEG